VPTWGHTKTPLPPAWGLLTPDYRSTDTLLLRSRHSLALQPLQGYCRGMAEVKKQDFGEPAPILDEEDEATLAAIDRGIKATDEGRVLPSGEVRQRMRQWLTKSSSPKTR